MEKTKFSILRTGLKMAALLVLWAVTVWLFYPMITLDSIEMGNAKVYLYRSAIGIAIMLILLGKTVFDLLFPQTQSEAKSLLNTVFLTLYGLAIASGIIFMVSRTIVLYIRSVDTG